MAAFVSVFVVLGQAFHKNLTSVQKRFRNGCTRRVMTWYFNNFEFQVCFLTGSREELLMFYLSKMIWCFRLAQSNLKIILSNRQCVPLLHAWWIYVKHSKRAEHAETGKFQRKNKSNNQRPRNLKNKEGDFSNIKLTIIFCVIYFSFDLDASKSGEVYPAIHRRGRLTESTAVVKQLINESSSSKLKD